MSTPILDKDKTPLMLLEERVKELEEKVKALDMAHYTPTPGIDDGIFDPGITPCATSDPQELYVLDTKPR